MKRAKTRTKRLLSPKEQREEELHPFPSVNSITDFILSRYSKDELETLVDQDNFFHILAKGMGVSYKRKK